jgi:hypothetical protein
MGEALRISSPSLFDIKKMVFATKKMFFDTKKIYFDNKKMQAAV